MAHLWACDVCGRKISSNARSCPGCGEPQIPDDDARDWKPYAPPPLTADEIRANAERLESYRKRKAWTCLGWALVVLLGPPLILGLVTLVMRLFYLLLLGS